LTVQHRPVRLTPARSAAVTTIAPWDRDADDAARDPAARKLRRGTGQRRRQVGREPPWPANQPLVSTRRSEPADLNRLRAAVMNDTSPEILLLYGPSCAPAASAKELDSTTRAT